MANPTPINDGLHVDAVSGVGVTTAKEARLVQAGAYARNGALGTIVARQGIVYAGKQNLLTQTSTGPSPMTIQVEPLHFVGSKSSTEGAYVGCVDVAKTVDVAAAPGSNSRIDVVWVAQTDQNAGVSPDVATGGQVGVITGTPAVTPSEPSMSAAPVGAVKIGTVTVPSGATSTNSCTVVTACVWTAPLGTPIPVQNQTERDALTAYPGLQVYRIDLGFTERYNGVTGGWQGATTPANNQVGGYTLTASYTDVTNMSVTLTKGRWLVVAKGNLDYSTGTARTYDLKLTDGADKDTVSALSGTNGKLPFTLMTSVSYSANTVVKLQAKASAVDGTQLVANGRIIAHPLIGS